MNNRRTVCLPINAVATALILFISLLFVCQSLSAAPYLAGPNPTVQKNEANPSSNQSTSSNGAQAHPKKQAAKKRATFRKAKKRSAKPYKVKGTHPMARRLAILSIILSLTASLIGILVVSPFLWMALCSVLAIASGIAAFVMGRRTRDVTSRLMAVFGIILGSALLVLIFGLLIF